MKHTTSEMLTALRTAYADNEDLNRALAEIWLKDGERVMMKIDAIVKLYDQHFSEFSFATLRALTDHVNREVVKALEHLETYGQDVELRKAMRRMITDRK